MGALADYIEKRWGAKSHSIENPLVDTVGVGVTRIANNNPDRFELVVVNYDAVLMRLAPTIEVSATRGIPLDPAGGFAVITATDDGEQVGYEWYIYSAGGGTIYVLETEAQ